ncbi:MAG: hypothetical protein GWO20_11535 [Candidatus Korarchaeota archaeon]|nr:hypothetical protein [Candidatus Korarchaeota archaeon]NIU84075.1 hypothetical protein [Candidatus Thorarchaeota archaeon]NIW13403.1 hypothetical protein [Candidatus Thorarchaeota archaeon]NIW51528.1 hypothetical protein [Candidatus Korarchaeota archaeon]
MSATSELTVEQEERIKSELREFIQNFTAVSEKGETKKKYREKLVEIAYDSEKRSLVVDYPDLALDRPEIATTLYSNPKKIIQTFKSALRESLEIVNEDLEGPEIRKHRVRIKGIKKEVKIRDLFRADLIGKLVSFKGIIVKATKVRPKLTRGMFKCKSCGHEFPHSFPSGFFHTPRICPEDGCDNTRSFKLLKQGREFEEFQTLTLQESPEEVPPGELPQSIPVRVKGDLAGKARPGERVTVYGILDVYPMRKLREGVNPLFNVFVESSYIKSEERGEEEVTLAEAEKQKIKELKGDPKLEEKIIKSIAPSIYGYEEIKKAIAAALFGGVHKELADGTELRDTVNLLLIGDPGTGKSQILKYAAKSSPRGLYTSGKGSSAAGLTAAVVKAENEWSLEAGALILADKGVACIDEFDKMSDKDRRSLHEAMEQLSYHPSTEITLANGNLVNIGNFVDRMFEQNHERIVDGVNCQILPLSENIPVLSTDFETLRPVNIDRLSRHKAPDYFYKIQFSNGRSVFVTPEHPMFVYDSGITTVNPSQLSVGEFVPAPREVLYEADEISLDVDFNSGHKPVHLPDTITSSLAYFLGYLATEGYSYDGSAAEVGLSNSDPTIISHMIDVIESTFHIEPLDYTEENRTIQIISRTLFDYLESNFPNLMKKSYEKRIPRLLFACPEEIRIAFLNAAFIGDGSVETETCAYSTNSKGLAHDYQDLLLTLGIHTRIHSEEYEYSNENKSRYRYKVYIRGDSLEHFASTVIPENTNGKFEKYRSKLNNLILRSKQTNRKRDNLPGQVATIIKDCLKALGLTYDGSLYQHIEHGYSINIEVVKDYLKILKEKYKVLLDLQIASDIRKLRGVTGYSQNQIAQIAGTTRGAVNYYEREGYSDERQVQVLSKVEHGLNSHLRQIKDKIDYLEKLCSFRWLKVKSIEKVPNSGKYKTDWVYDITVEPTRNFISQGVILHNTVSIAKAGIVATLNARTSIVAAANPKFGRYLPDREISENITLPMTILSRFDLIFVVRDIPQTERDKAMASHILGLHSKEFRPSPVFSPNFLKKYIRYAREYITPTFTKAAHEKLLDFYLRLRDSSKSGSGMGPIAITVRQLEALVRLSEAHARMLLREEVREYSADFAIELMKKSLFQVAQESGTETLDIDKISSTGISHKKRARYAVVLDIIKEKEEEFAEGVPLRTILEEAKKKGIENAFVKDILKREKKRGGIYEPSQNHYKVVP